MSKQKVLKSRKQNKKVLELISKHKAALAAVCADESCDHNEGREAQLVEWDSCAIRKELSEKQLRLFNNPEQCHDSWISQPIDPPLEQEARIMVNAANVMVLLHTVGSALKQLEDVVAKTFKADTIRIRILIDEVSLLKKTYGTLANNAVVLGATKINGTPKKNRRTKKQIVQSK